MEQFPALCWPDWEIVELIGSGSYGRVYKIKREENQHTYYDALKVITIPKDASEILNLRNNGMDDANIAEYFREQANKIFQEIDTMIQLGGVTNIVGYKDHKMMEREDTIGCDIFIRMELLTPLSKYLQTNRLTPQLVVRMGIDIVVHSIIICKSQNGTLLIINLRNARTTSTALHAYRSRATTYKFQQKSVRLFAEQIFYSFYVT